MRDRRRPFWQPAANYYMLAVALAAGFFFLAWGLLHDAGEETPWVPAGIAASVMLAATVVMREVVLRRAARRQQLAEQADEARSQAAALRSFRSDSRDGTKLTIEQNSALVKEIKQKSEAAKLLHRFSSSHREVFDMCSEYLALNEHELKSVNPNSPRLAPLLRGRSAIAEYQRYHLLKWAEIETRNLTSNAQNLAVAADRIEAAQGALGVLQAALHFYPTERDLIESHSLISEMIVSIKVNDWTTRAERAAFKGDYAQARSDYRDALFELRSRSAADPAHGEAARRIEAEIAHLESLSDARDGDLSKGDAG